MVLAITWMMIGGFFYTFTIGNLSSVLSNLDTRESALSEKLGAVIQFSKQSKLDKELRERVKKTITYVTKRNFLWADKKVIF